MAGLASAPGRLTCEAVKAVLTCALLASLAVDALRLDQGEPIIRQVTDDHHKQYKYNNIVGTERKFEMFMEKYGKTYGSREEYSRRLAIFARNLARAAEHQALDPTAVHGVTPFSDLSEDEFHRMYTGLRGGPGLGRNTEAAAVAVESGGPLPESFDWREKGAVTEVKRQVNKYFVFLCFFF